ncbi:MAG TPA: hypothetical protein VFF82_01870 [Rhodocyclaceae bacterium]|nr:hypothetical protein [Rhodocyclaceae bacterium]
MFRFLKAVAIAIATVVILFEEWLAPQTAPPSGDTNSSGKDALVD